MGMIGRWAPLAAAWPALTNLFTQTPGLSSLAKAVAGIAPERSIARFAPRSFRKLFATHAPKGAGDKRVMLWPDTFNNYFHPQTAMAAVRVLEHAGYRVEIPSVRLCCGRPLYDFGLLDQAKQQLRDILDALRPAIEAGVPLVGLEPACLAVFRDEMVNLFPNDALALRLAEQSFMFSEFLVKQARYTPPRLQMKAIVHGHCHQKAVVGMADEVALLGAMGLDFDLLDSGCCGMAGSFGFDKHKVDLSMRIGELVLLPRGPRSCVGHADHHERVQLPGADRARCAAQGHAPRRGDRPGDSAPGKRAPAAASCRARTSGGRDRIAASMVGLYWQVRTAHALVDLQAKG